MKNPFRLLFYLQLLGLPAVFVSGCQNKQKTQKAIPTHRTTVVQKKDSALIDSTDYIKRVESLNTNDVSKKWKNKAPCPLPGAILAYKRVVAFYGNLYSKRMGILGELPKEQMLKQLKEEANEWQLADPNIPTIPALHYIPITAQSKPGKNNKYRLRMPFRQIDTIMVWANSIQGIVFLDVQVGQSSVKEEVNSLKDYLKLANVYLAIDSEFAMKKGEIPGTKIGTLSTHSINEAITILAKIVKKNNLPPKILVIHRFTKPMVTDYQKTKTCPEVQIVMNMDGFGNKALKRSSYHMAIYHEPVQFTGFKLFYKNDTRGKQILYTPKELL
jgi:hypothetical protein